MPRFGPSSGSAGANVLFAGGLLRAEVTGLALEQRIDLIWRRPDGTIEAVLVFEESFCYGAPQPASEDWRCVLAAAIMRVLYGENPDVHTLWVSEGVARVEHTASEVLQEKLGFLSETLRVARAFEGCIPPGESVFYRLSESHGQAEYDPQQGRRQRRRPRGSRPRRGE